MDSIEDTNKQADKNLLFHSLLITKRYGWVRAILLVHFFKNYTVFLGLMSLVVDIIKRLGRIELKFELILIWF